MSNYQSYTPDHGPVEVNPIPDAVQIRGTVHRTSFVDGVMSQTNTPTLQTGSASQLNPYHGTDSVFATATTVSGHPVTEITPATLVTINKMQAPVSFWVEQGHIKKEADGSFTEVAGGPPATPLAVDPNADFSPIRDEVMATINDALGPLPDGNLEGFIGISVGAAVGRLDEAKMVEHFAQTTGLEVAESSARVEAIKGAYQAQADEALTAKFGVAKEDLPAFYTWCRTKHPEALSGAVHKQLRTHDVSGYRTLATQWLSATPPSSASLKAAGVPVRNAGNKTEVYLRGTWMSSAAAAAAGMI